MVTCLEKAKMALQGEKKKDYQREYMRLRRQGLAKSDKRGNRPPSLICLADVRPVRPHQEVFYAINGTG